MSLQLPRELSSPAHAGYLPTSLSFHQHLLPGKQHITYLFCPNVCVYTIWLVQKFILYKSHAIIKTEIEPEENLEKSNYKVVSSGREKLRIKAIFNITRLDTRLPKLRAGGQGLYLRSPDHLGRSREVLVIKS